MTRHVALVALLLVLAALLAGAGVWAWRTAPTLATHPLPAGLDAPASELARAPAGVAAGAWVANALLDARRDGLLLLLGGLVAVAALVDRFAPGSRRRLRSAALGVLAYLALLPLAGAALAALRPDLYAWARGAMAFAQGVVLLTLAHVLVFDVVLPLVRWPARPILRDLIVGAGWVVVAVTVLARSGLQLGGLLTGSAVVGAIVGLSVQSTLGDAVSGLLLEWESSIDEGDWITVGDVTGRVREIRWRHTRLETRNWESVLIPNSALMKSNVLVLGRRDGAPVQWRRWVHFRVPFEHRPTDVIAAVEAALCDGVIERVASDPRPNCILHDLRGEAAQYAVRYWLTDLAVDDPTDSAVRARVHAALCRAGVPFAVPPRDVRLRDAAETARAAERERQERQHGLERFSLLAPLTDAERAQLVPHLTVVPFAPGETITTTGHAAHWLYLLAEGEVTVQIAAQDGRRRTVARLAAPESFGEMAMLTGEPRSADVVAATPCVCWRLDRAAFREILLARPEVAAELSRVLARRRMSLEEARATADTWVPNLRAEQDRILGQISRFFGLS